MRSKKNQASPLSLYSYTKYDQLGRINEVGQIRDTASGGTMNDATSRSKSSLDTWFTLRKHLRGQITETVYDTAYAVFVGLPNPRLVLGQRNLRNRVSYVTLNDTA